MSRQSEINKMQKALEKWGEGSDWNCAEYLVDNGIGTKDRFEIDWVDKNNILVKEYIKPINYEDKQ